MPSHPLVTLTNLFNNPTFLAYIEALPEDDPLLPVIEAAEELAEGWSFWPPDQYGSSYAVVSHGEPETLIEALSRYDADAR